MTIICDFLFKFLPKLNFSSIFTTYTTCFYQYILTNFPKLQNVGVKGKTGSLCPSWMKCWSKESHCDMGFLSWQLYGGALKIISLKITKLKVPPLFNTATAALKFKKWHNDVLVRFVFEREMRYLSDTQRQLMKGKTYPSSQYKRVLSFCFSCSCPFCSNVSSYTKVFLRLFLHPSGVRTCR